MKKLYLLPLILTLLFTFFESNLNASHLAGGEITYTNVGRDAYRITLTLYGDCSGAITLLDEPKDVSIRSLSCNKNIILKLQLDSTKDVSAICKSKLSQSRCSNGGNITPAYKAFIYSAVANLPPCSDWIMEFSESLRNNGITNTTRTSDFFIRTTANLILGRNNNSPKFFAYPTPTFYVNSLGSFNNASYDIDGDSLSYELTTPLGTNGNPLTFTAGLSATQPIPSVSGVTFSPNTGLLLLTPSAASLNALAMKVTEWRNNQEIGTFIRDIQVVVSLNSSNNAPPNTGNTTPIQLKDIIGGYKIANKVRPSSLVEINGINEFSICPGDSLNLDIDIYDNASQKLEFLRTNVSLSLPGAKITFTKITDNHVIAKLRFLPKITQVGFNSFSIIVGDNQCDHIYKSYLTYSIQIRPKLSAGEDLVICGLKDTAKITLLYPGKNTTWRALSGDPIKLGQNFSCSNDCKSIKAWPNVTTTYEVTTEFNSIESPCNNKDTIIVKRIPEYKLTSIPKDLFVCRGQTTSVTTYPSPVIDFDFNYSWEPKYLFLSPNKKSSKLAFSAPGQQKVFVTASYGKAKGCVKKDTVSINVSNVYNPSIDWLNPTNLLACGAKSYKFNIRPGATLPANCQVATSINCTESLSSTSPPKSTELTNNANTFPSPFAFNNSSSKHQFLYRAGDIIKSGFTGGKVTAISFFIRNLNSSSRPIKSSNVSIKMGCTSKDTLTKTTFETGLMPVSGTPLIRRDVDLVKGWNQLNLEVGFEWNGYDNIIVEICAERGASSITSNPSFWLEETDYNSSISAFNNSSINSACTMASFGSNPFPKRRAIIRFKKCTIFADPNDFTYTWTPTNLLDNATIQNPTATISKNQTFKLKITDKSGGECSDSLEMNIKLRCCTKISGLSITDSLCPTDPSGILRFIASSPNRPLRVILTKNNDKDTIRNTLIAANFSVGSLSADKYKLYIIDSKGCIKDTALEIKKFSLRGAHITGVKAICRGNVTTLNLIGNGFTDIRWSNGSTSTSAEYGPGPVKVSFLYEACRQEIETTVPEFSKPNADFSISPEISARTGETVYFTPKHGTITAFKWNLGFGYTSSNSTNIKSPSNTYSQGGDYTIQLIAENSGGCKDTVTKDYTVIAPLDLPNVITPNGDSKNDFLVISALDHSLYNSTMEVFDRWGKPVYKANNYANDWGAEGLPNGTYYYIISLDDVNKSIFKGFFEVIK